MATGSLIAKLEPVFPKPWKLLVPAKPFFINLYLKKKEDVYS